MAHDTSDLSLSFSRAGHKLTAPRRAVLQTVSGMRSTMTARQLLLRARRVYPRLGLVTVYRTLDILLALGHIRRAHLEVGSQTYVAATAPHGHHLICSRCGAAVEFDKCGLAAMLGSVARQTGYSISGHQLEVFGQCPRCQGARQREATR